jgi:hypothetical protein
LSREERLVKKRLAIALITGLIAAGCGADDEAPAPAEPPAAARPAPGAPADRPAPPSPVDEAEPDDVAPPEEPLPLPLDRDLPEGARPSGGLPDDIRMPAGGRATEPTMLWDEEEITQGTYVYSEPPSAIRASLMANLLQDGWSTDRTSASGSDQMFTARKGNRELTVVMSENEGKTEVMIMEMESPSAP